MCSADYVEKQNVIANVTVRDIQSIFLALFKANELKEIGLSRRIYLVMNGMEKEADIPLDPIYEVVKKYLFYNITTLLAARLREDDHKIPLISNEDYSSLLSSAMDEYFLQLEREMLAEDRTFMQDFVNGVILDISTAIPKSYPSSEDSVRAFIQAFMNGFVVGVSTAISEIFPSSSDDIYKQSWTMIRMVSDIAKERNSSLYDLFRCKNWNDGLIQHSSTKEGRLVDLTNVLQQLMACG